MDLYALQQESLQPELLNIRLLIESVLKELFSRYAKVKAIRLMPRLIDIEPVLLNRNLTLRSLNDVIDNAIKFSNPGGVVEVTLSLNDKGPKGKPGKWIWVDVKDTGKGIKKEDWEKIFELRKRADGLVEPGSGLGLYLARRAARRQGGDVELISSKVNEGSTFRIFLPYRAGEVQEL
jgi:signal transduction histidine kinase